MAYSRDDKGRWNADFPKGQPVELSFDPLKRVATNQEARLTLSYAKAKQSVRQLLDLITPCLFRGRPAHLQGYHPFHLGPWHPMLPPRELNYGLLAGQLYRLFLG